MSAISPELALIDPQLAAAARALLPDPGQFRPAAVRRTLSDANPRLSEQAPAAFDGPATPRRGRRGGAVGLVLVICAIGATWAVPKLQERIAGRDPLVVGLPTPPVVSTTALPERASARAPAAAVYTWPAVPGVDAYEFRVMRGAETIYTTMTETPALELPEGLILAPAVYTWSATPLADNSSASGTARPVIEGTFEIGQP